MNKATPAPKAPSSYELMGARIQKIINSPAAQKAKHALLHRLPDEPEAAWAQILEEIGETDNVTVAHRDDGGVELFWVVPKED